jgi:pilus assembly protein CpaC
VRAPLPPAEVAKYVQNVSSNDAAFQVVVGQARVLTLKEDIKLPPHLVGVGDPTIIDFNVINTRQVRIIGQRIGITDFSIVSAENHVYTFEVQVVPDLDLLRSRIRVAFPDAMIKVSNMREHIVLEGQARDALQVEQIHKLAEAFLASVRGTENRKIPAQIAQSFAKAGMQQPALAVTPPGVGPGGAPLPVTPELAPFGGTAPGSTVEPRIINLIRIPGSQQVLLKVRVAELNRTAMRQIGADFLAIDPTSGAIVGTNIGGAAVSGLATAAGGALTGTATNSLAPQTSVFGIFQKGDFDLMFNALRQNTLLKILAEPNLMAMNGHQASFLAGGEFPVPVAQSSSGGAAPTVTVQFQKFGVELYFIPYILDGDTIRLSVHPSVSSIDRTLGTVLVPGGTPVPGLDIREAQTTVELHEGQTLAIAGLLQLTLDGSTTRIPGLGDLPILGPFFSNTTGDRLEKELVVLVTPYLVEPENHPDVPGTPGDEVVEPTDFEFYLLNRIEGRKRDFRSTTEYDDALHVLRCFLKIQDEHVHGAYGYCK